MMDDIDRNLDRIRKAVDARIARDKDRLDVDPASVRIIEPGEITESRIHTISGTNGARLGDAKQVGTVPETGGGSDDAGRVHSPDQIDRGIAAVAEGGSLHSEAGNFESSGALGFAEETDDKINPLPSSGNPDDAVLDSTMDGDSDFESRHGAPTPTEAAIEEVGGWEGPPEDDADSQEQFDVEPSIWTKFKRLVGFK